MELRMNRAVLKPNGNSCKFHHIKMLKHAWRNVIIKLGGKGCFFKNREESMLLPAYGIDVVDATGAGDNFMAGLVSELIRGSGIKEALTFASACGAICTTAVGTGTALKDRHQVLEFMKGYRG